MKTKITVLIITFFCSCQIGSENKAFRPTKFSDDVKAMTLEQTSTSPDRKFFLAVFYDESKSMSGIKVLKLYRFDSLSVNERYYGAHPLQVDTWTDTGIIFNAGVFSAHGDYVYRKQYLDGSVDRNKTLGSFKVLYKKNYNFHR